jgi:hypothetical protein
VRTRTAPPAGPGGCPGSSGVRPMRGARCPAARAIRCAKPSWRHRSGLPRSRPRERHAGAAGARPRHGPRVAKRESVPTTQGNVELRFQQRPASAARPHGSSVSPSCKASVELAVQRLGSQSEFGTAARAPRWDAVQPCPDDDHKGAHGSGHFLHVNRWPDGEDRGLTCEARPVSKTVAGEPLHATPE